MVMQGELGLSDGEFWTAPEKTRARLEDKALSEDKEVLVVDAPHKVDLHARQTAPLAVLRFALTDTVGAIPLALYAVVVAADLQRGEAWSEMAVAPPSRPVPPREPFEFVGDNAHSGEMRIVDLRERLDLPWRPAKLAVWMLLREREFGPLFVELGEPPTAYKDKAVAEAHEGKLKAGPLPPLSPSPHGGLVAWGSEAGAPAVPGKPGITVHAPRLLKTGDFVPCVVRGSFRLPIAPRFVVKPGKEHDALAHALGKGPVPAALVPMLAVTTSTLQGQGFRWSWTLPAESVEGTPEAPIAVGRFAIDLSRLGNLSGEEGTIFLHLFSGQAHGRADIAFSREAE